MKLAFTKLPGKADLLVITRTDGSTARVDCPKQGMIPHDMVHYAVEKVVQADGFLTRVAAGSGLGFAEGSAPSAEPIERLVEVMQADTWSMANATDVDDLLGLYTLSCDERGHSPLPITPVHIAAIRSEMAELARCWAEVPLHGTFRLELPS